MFIQIIQFWHGQTEVNGQRSFHIEVLMDFEVSPRVGSVVDVSVADQVGRFDGLSDELRRRNKIKRRGREGEVIVDHDGILAIQSNPDGRVNDRVVFDKIRLIADRNGANTQASVMSVVMRLELAGDNRVHGGRNLIRNTKNGLLSSLL